LVRQYMKNKQTKKFIKKTVTSYPLGDFLIRIKNAAMAGRKTLVVEKTNPIKDAAEALKRMRYLDKVEEKDGFLTLFLTFKNKTVYLTDLKLVSKPGLRIYWGSEDIQKHKGPSTFLISTPKGMLSSKEAIKENIGGEIVAEII